MNFKPKALPFCFADYEPIIAAEIMELHYEKHYKGYLNNLNNAFSSCADCCCCSLPEILNSIDKLPQNIKDIVRNNGGGVANHELFWEILNPKTPSKPSSAFISVINSSFGSFDNMQDQIFKVASNLFGAGWAWLTITKDKKLKIYGLPNQDSPFMNGEVPILGIDVWEHSYYIQYKNVKAEYLKNVWKIIDWSVVEEKYNACLGK